MPVVIADLSNGLEGKKLPVVVDNFNFEYICGGLEIGPELNGLFAKNESTTNATNEQHQGTAQIPPPLLSANLDFEVFNAGGGKGWGLRSVQQIDQPNLALFEYCGVLKLADGHQIVEDDYIFEFEYGEELTLDYGQKWWEAKSALNCACGTENCKFNGKPGEDSKIVQVMAASSSKKSARKHRNRAKRRQRRAQELRAADKKHPI